MQKNAARSKRNKATSKGLQRALLKILFPGTLLRNLTLTMKKSIIIKNESASR